MSGEPHTHLHISSTASICLRRHLRNEVMNRWRASNAHQTHFHVVVGPRELLEGSKCAIEQQEEE